MNDTDAKSPNHGNGNSVQSDVWRPGYQEVDVAPGEEPRVDLSMRRFRHEAEVHAINCALRHTGGNRKRAAKLLSISYRCLLYKIRQHNILPRVQHS